MNKILTCFLFSSLAFSFQLTAQQKPDTCSGISFQKIYTVSAAALPSGILQTKDGGFFVSGSQTNELVGNGDGFLLKTNKYGDKEWIKGYNRTGADYVIYGSIQLPDSSYIAVTEQFDSRGGLQKVDKNGVLVWQKSYYILDGAIRFTNIVALPDGNFVACGTKTESTFSGSNIFLKFNPDGNIIWQRSFDIGNHTSYPSSISVSGNTLLVTGIIPDFPSVEADTAYIMTMNNDDGALYKAKKIWQDVSAIIGLSLVSRTDNNYILTASLQNRINGSANNTVLQLTPDLNIVQSIKLANVPDGFLGALTRSGDNGIVSTISDAAADTGFIIKLDQNLQPVFAKYYQQQYAGSNRYYFSQINSATDGGFVIAGTRKSDDAGTVYIVKTDKDGNSGDCNSFSIFPTTISVTLSSEDLHWSVVMDPQVIEEDVNVPDVVLNSDDITLCSKSSCDNICNVLNQPSNFLPADTSVCLLAPFSILAKTGYTKYLWNNNSTGPFLLITHPGLYWLEVTDTNNCKGKDSILVSLKACFKKFYIPGAFTPNNDGKNDVFKPLLPGDPEKYKFIVYNRWGQIVFQTTDFMKGWDGTYGGMILDSDVFVWVCNYRLTGGPNEMRKGTVALIR